MKIKTDQLLIGVAQFDNCLNWQKNYQNAIDTINYFSRKKADLVCFQEAFLSGYHLHIFMYDFSYIDYFLNLIRVHAYKKKICVSIPTIELRNNKYYSAVYIFNGDSGDSIIYKKGLTPSELILMTPKKSKKTFALKGFKLGVLICREMQDHPFEYLDKLNLPDLILWPSYWGWNYKNKWGPIRLSDGKKDLCFLLIKKIKRPLIQMNMSNTFGHGEKLLRAGKSVVVNSQNKKIGMGKFGKKDRFLVSFDGLKLKFLPRIS